MSNAYRSTIQLLVTTTLLAANLLFTTSGFAQPAVSTSALADTIDASLAPYFKSTEPGATVIVTKDGKPIFRKGYGLADLEGKAAMQPEMVLRLGSITKQFTSAGVMALVDQGKLAVSDDITKFLPGFPTQDRKITIEHLLTHTSGIRSYTSIPTFRTVMQKDMSVAQVIDLFKNEPLEFEPGTRYAYSNSGYFLLGAIIEKISGMTYADFMAKTIFEPLDMKNTAYEGHERSGAKRIEGYSVRNGAYEKAMAISMTLPFSAGALVSNVDDLAKWDAAIAAGKLLKPQTWKQVFTPYKLANGETTNYGYGWVVRKIQGSNTIEHDGGIDGFSTSGIRMPDDKVYVAVLANADTREAAPRYLAEKVAAIAIGKPYPEQREIKLDAAKLDRLIGIYKISDRVTRVITRSGDTLFMQRTGGPKVKLAANSETEFFVPNSFIRAKFNSDEKAQVKEVIVFQNGEEQLAPRISATPPAERQAIGMTSANFDKFVGEYQLAPGFVLTISRDGEKFYAQAAGQGRNEIFAESTTRFFLKVVDAQLQFAKDEQGNVTQLTLLQGGREIPGKKIR